MVDINVRTLVGNRKFGRIAALGIFRGISSAVHEKVMATWFYFTLKR